jgi:hypothetical protein
LAVGMLFVRILCTRDITSVIMQQGKFI